MKIGLRVEIEKKKLLFFVFEIKELKRRKRRYVFASFVDLKYY